MPFLQASRSAACCESRCRRSSGFRCAIPNHHALTGSEVDRRLRFPSEELIDGLSGAGAGDETVVIEEHDSSVSEPRVEEFAALPDGVVQVGVDVNQCETAPGKSRH